MMSRQLRWVADAFQALSLAMGIPSFIAFVFLAWQSARLHFQPGAPARGSASGDQMVDLFVSGFRIFGKVMEWFAGAVEWFLLALTALAFLVVLFAVVLYLTSRGLRAHRAWARFLGIALSLIPLFLSVMVGLSLNGAVARLPAVAVAACSGYVIWTLARPYSAAPLE